MSDKKPTIFDVLGPGKTFAAGFVAAFLAFSTIGFYVLLFQGSSFSFSTRDEIAPVTEFGVKANANPDLVAVDSAGTEVEPELNIQPVSSDENIRGDLNTAEVVVVEFSDFDCPFCYRFHTTMQQIVNDYQGRVAWAYRHFPLDSLHPNARTKAEASECVADLGGNDAFWKFADILMDENRTVTVVDLGKVAQEAGVSQSAFQTCLDEGKFKAKIDADLQDAVANGGRGTPYSVVLTRAGEQTPINGALPYEQVKTILDSILQ